MKVQALRPKACRNNSNSGINSAASNLNEVRVNLREKLLKFLWCFVCVCVCLCLRVRESGDRMEGTQIMQIQYHRL